MAEGVMGQKLQEKVLMVNRVAKKIKGGERRGFTALVAVGDGCGKVGIGYGRAQDLRVAIEKGRRQAKVKMFAVPISGTTIPHRVEVKEGAVKIILKPAPRGAGLIAGGVIRDLLELAGYGDVSAKMLGTRNRMANVKATVTALRGMRNEA
ncbi:30S ribosomal protein S5 [candidate division WWE3 bacterium CG09_land_8_20_14_0_10_47_33]|uniref:Small ribosomal subunit protein uS5 n=1 Tax=candidate division WWE3 bacterium CG_4_9_14_0_2_um_filter_48_10 TaxID=1975078 RepID=A0A2M8EJR8_UNCKA|nr:MAG: 30S ribosomal protein S5 [candidate division WWE3 bacterium CG09_land_8_20_14_0_10_47_33]PIZ40535.1 MAG: 30S ribosomal protein S5 [candidate division WWE3 bacterium CG_4_10_14_0_2_um_filter_47_8]PJC22986.1 MAG: 30S ribosomal protein S5 [candidate division WWE3 bacterium CG_4_9_14_0_2_um_filter_48_10]PJE51228.1 MAG: 30S ribosomal protein S5 [candidate division WWE3 bacterium CG10_big_fil_rev_8_21_14_0_10_48_23]